MKSTTLLLICGIGLLVLVLIPLDFYANKLVTTNAKEGKEVYSFSSINKIQQTQFVLIGLISGLFLSRFIVWINDLMILKRISKRGKIQQ